MEGKLENLTEGGEGGQPLWKSRWEGGSEPKNTTSRVTFDFIDVSVASIDKFSTNLLLCIFKFYYSFKLQTSYHIYFKFPSIGSPSLLCRGDMW